MGTPRLGFSRGFGGGGVGFLEFWGSLPYPRASTTNPEPDPKLGPEVCFLESVWDLRDLPSLLAMLQDRNPYTLNQLPVQGKCTGGFGSLLLALVRGLWGNIQCVEKSSGKKVLYIQKGALLYYPKELIKKHEFKNGYRSSRRHFRGPGAGQLDGHQVVLVVPAKAEVPALIEREPVQGFGGFRALGF